MIQNHIKRFSFQTFYSQCSFSFATATASAKKQKTLYQILQVPTSAPQSNIRKNYLKLAKIFHPDVYKGADKGRFQQIKKAYQTLSDVRKRLQYDQQIGIRKRTSQPTSQQFQGTSTSPQSDQINKRNNFTYDTTTTSQQPLNLDQQYQKFFKKKKQTDFQQIRLHEQAQFRQMNEKQRMRFRVRELYDNDAAQLKIKQTKSFEELLDDQIGQRNVHHEDIQRKVQNIEKLHSEQGIKKQKIIVYTLAVLGAIVFYPLLFSFWTKYRLEQEQKRKVLQLMQDMRVKAQEADIRSRFQY